MYPKERKKNMGRKRDRPKQQLPNGFESLSPFLAEFEHEHPHSERNVFVMMPFKSNLTDRIWKAVVSELEHHGLVALRADQRAFAPVLWWNVATYMIGSSYGILIYQPKDRIPFNPSVSIEAGFMIALDRPVLILANKELSALPVNFAGHVYKNFDPRKVVSTVQESVRDWLLHDLSYFRLGRKKVIVFVSVGGTCRCAMAKAIFSHLLHENKITSVAVEAAAVAEPHKPYISVSAVAALKEAGYDHWLESHRPRKLCRYLQEKAHLIVVFTSHSLPRSASRKAKVTTDDDLFGKNTYNPFPDFGDDESLHKYRKGRDELENHLRNNFWKILGLLGARPKV